MSDEEWKVIDSLRSQGYAITIFTPDELDGVDIDTVEDMMVARGWDAIAMMGGKGMS